MRSVFAYQLTQSPIDQENALFIASLLLTLILWHNARTNHLSCLRPREVAGHLLHGDHGMTRTRRVVFIPESIKVQAFCLW